LVLLRSLKQFVLCLTGKSNLPMIKDTNSLLIPKSRRDLRALAFHIVYAADRSDYSVPIDEIIQNFRDGFNLVIEEDSFAVRMAKGAIEMRQELDAIIKPLLLNWKLERLGCCTRIILRLALWELKQPESIPSVVINEAIELAKCFAEKEAYKFVNGILDEASKQE
jgi:transcription antitermination protein NusB